MARNKRDEVHIDDSFDMVWMWRWLCGGWRRYNCCCCWRWCCQGIRSCRSLWQVVFRWVLMVEWVSTGRRMEAWYWTSWRVVPVFPVVRWMLTEHLSECRLRLRRWRHHLRSRYLRTEKRTVMPLQCLQTTLNITYVESIYNRQRRTPPNYHTNRILYHHQRKENNDGRPYTSHVSWTYTTMQDIYPMCSEKWKTPAWQTQNHARVSVDKNDP